MKKRLLITSIVMMLVVAVALSTATYAWFTSNAGVTASSITLTAESNAGASIGIAWGTDQLASAITAKAPTEGSKLAPIAPATCANGVTAANVAFETATMRQSGGNYVFNGPTEGHPFEYESVSSQKFFRVANTSTSNIATVTLSLYDVTGSQAAADTNNLLRVGVFTSATSDGSYTLAAVLSVTDHQEIAYGDIVADARVDQLVASNAKVYTDDDYSFDLDETSNQNGQSVIYFKVIAWMDGYALNDATASSTATFGLRFNAVKKVVSNG